MDDKPARSAGRPPPESADWLRPPAEEEGLVRIARTLRERARIVVVAVVVSTIAAIAYVATASKVYEAEAQLLVTPVSGNDPTLGSLGLIQASSDPLRAVETAAALVTTNEVAASVARKLDRKAARGPDLLGDVRAEPVAQSNLVTVTARAGDPGRAQRLANAFLEAAVARRTSQFHEAVADLIGSIKSRIGRGAPGLQDLLRGQLGELQALRAAATPDMRIEAPADVPRSPVAPRRMLSLLGGILAGLVLGVGAAFARDVFDPTLRREDQLRRLFRVPVLARIPREPSREGQPLDPGQLSIPAVEAYRTLRASLAARGGNGLRESHSILVTGSSPCEGKTTTAINLAVSLALSGNSVILIDADLRRPALGRALGVQASRGIVGVLIETAGLAESLVATTAFGPNLELLPAEHEGGWITDLLALPSAKRMLDDAKRLADYVIIDSPPLAEVVDALPLARHVDQVVIVARLGKSSTRRLQHLGELLAENGVRPAGITLVGTERPSTPGYLSAPGRSAELDDRGRGPSRNGSRPAARARDAVLRRGESAPGRHRA